MSTDSGHNSKKLKNLNWLLLVALIFLIVVLSTYFYSFHHTLSSDKSEWGTFGDFVGGTLNPLFAFLSLFAIIYTIRIQTEELEYSRKELEATKEELEKSRIAQQEQSESFKIQNESIKQQAFENTFFQLVNALTDTKNNISVNVKIGKTHTHHAYDNPQRAVFKIHTSYSINGLEEKLIKLDVRKDKEFQSYEAIKIYLQILKSDKSKITPAVYNKFNKEYEGYTGTYFGQIYQILKFIKNSPIAEEKKQDYVNLFRAQFSKEELEFLFYHCLGVVGSKRFKPLVEEFQFFEHISLNNEIKQNITDYAINAFGDNEEITEIFPKNMEEKTENLPISE
ncbi:MAG: putative phage abortive infection protein [Sulfurimonas sp.]|uniref:putative phage abortive infection protein n=1 Tax=Sulfurimonas sp. TaxID=2022749 RepID=UPI003D12F1C5